MGHAPRIGLTGAAGAAPEGRAYRPGAGRTGPPGENIRPIDGDPCPGPRRPPSNPCDLSV
ncbi:hypothetical protein Ae168Ps1_6002 [Pseudonocardia sp. Ae168_Ps1]|nr:hypothetical protein Ae168Ps1_6002 [Pseudonocardia sp. Ae168_Ps1]